VRILSPAPVEILRPKVVFLSKFYLQQGKTTKKYYLNIFINFKQKDTVNVFGPIRRLRRPKVYLELFHKLLRNIGVHYTQRL